MIVIIEGPMGTGKSNLMNKLIRERSRETDDQEIILCESEDVKTTKTIKRVGGEDLIKMTSDDFCDKIVGINEKILYAEDSRHSAIAINKLFCDMIASSANRNADFYICTTSFDCLDKRIRRATDYRILCKGIKNNKFVFTLLDPETMKSYCSGSLSREELWGMNILSGIKRSIGAKI